ncbi:MAG: hypothetical protein JWO03_3396 [Bacteroidetes bacterium]|nr:hypothetical protein [Bacteroidota bacterium]
MKQQSEYLFELIKSLNGPEKRYFTLYLRRHFKDGNISLSLFQTLQNQSIYNEDAAVKATAVSRNHFAVQKTILYKQLLQALIQYNADSDVLQRLQQEVFAAKLLLQKGLTHQAKVKVRQIKADAAQYEQHEIALQAIQLESVIAAREQFRNVSAEDIQGHYAETGQRTDDILAESAYRFAYNSAQKIQLQAGGKSDAKAKEVKALLKTINTRQAKKPLTRKALMDKMQTEALYHFMNRDTAKAFDINTEFIAMMEADSALIPLYPQRYFAALNNYLIDCFNLSRTEAFQTTLAKMRELKDNPAFKKLSNLEVNIFRITYQAELNYLISEGEFTKALAAVKDVKERLQKYGDSIPVHHRMNLEYLSAYMLFGAGKYEAASAILDSVQQYSRAETAAAPDVMTAVMQVICHYEMKSYSIIDSLVKSCKRKLNNHKEMLSEGIFELLNAINGFAVKLPTENDWKKLSARLESADSKTDAAYSNYFEYRVYVSAQARRIPYEVAWRSEKDR